MTTLNPLLAAGMVFKLVILTDADEICSLERDSHRRPPPSVMLGHAWMVEMSKKKVNMAKFLQQVWNWSE